MAKFNYQDAYDAFRYALETRNNRFRLGYFDNEPIKLNSALVKEVRRDYDGSMAITFEGHQSDFVKELPGLFGGHSKNELYRSHKEEIKRVIFNEPYTIVIWTNGEKTIVKAQDGEPYDKEKGLAMCFAKYALGNTCRYFDFFKEFCGEEEESKPTVLQKIKAREKKMRKEWGDKNE